MANGERQMANGERRTPERQWRDLKAAQGNALPITHKSILPMASSRFFTAKARRREEHKPSRDIAPSQNSPAEPFRPSRLRAFAVKNLAFLPLIDLWVMGRATPWVLRHGISLRAESPTQSTDWQSDD
jgi:hypothetical protein